MDDDELRALIEDVFEGYQPVLCPMCDGKGTLDRGLGVMCPRCGGQGVSQERVEEVA